jgi:hypothetical protein
MNLFELENTSTNYVKIVYDYLFTYHDSESNIITSSEIAKNINRLYGFNLTSQKIRSIIKVIRETATPRFKYVIKSKAGLGYYMLTDQDKKQHSANVKQFIGLAKSIMKSGEYKKGFLHQIINELETENLSEGQINTSNDVYEFKIKTNY